MEYFNEEGYPTEEYLNWLKNWEVWMEEELHETMIPNILQSLKITWAYGIKIEKIHNDKFKIGLHTYGSSNNESIIRALEENPLFWYYWIRHDVGGHYYFKFPKKYLASLN